MLNSVFKKNICRIFPHKSGTPVHNSSKDLFTFSGLNTKLLSRSTVLPKGEKNTKVPPPSAAPHKLHSEVMALVMYSEEANSLLVPF